MKLPLIRKIVPIGGSRGITLPKSWLELIQREEGMEITEVAVEVDNVLTVKPILPKKGISNG